MSLDTSFQLLEQIGLKVVWLNYSPKSKTTAIASFTCQPVQLAKRMLLENICAMSDREIYLYLTDPSYLIQLVSCVPSIGTNVNSFLENFLCKLWFFNMLTAKSLRRNPKNSRYPAYVIFKCSSRLTLSTPDTATESTYWTIIGFVIAKMCLIWKILLTL